MKRDFCRISLDNQDLELYNTFVRLNGRLSSVRGGLRTLWVTVAFTVATHQGFSEAEHVPAGVSSGTVRAAAVRTSGWRGDGTGCFPACRPPTEWSEGRNLLWRTRTGSSYSSPVLFGDRLFVMAEPDRLVALSAIDGRLLWERTSRVEDLPEDARPKETPRKIKTDCGNTTPTPVTDGRNVYVSLNSGIVAAYDLDGGRKWIRLLDLPPSTAHGRSASPVLAGGLLIVHISHLHALDPETGDVKWQTPDAVETYGTPAIATIGGKEVLVTPKGDVVRVSDGAILASGVGALSYASPVVRGRMVYFVDALSVALELPEEMKEKIEVKERWFTELEGEFFASPVLHDGLLFAVSAVSNYYVLDAETGKTVLSRTPLDLAPAGAVDAEGTSVYASVTFAGKNIFLCNNKGATLVLEAGGEYKEVGRGSLADGSAATPVFGGDRMYVRAGDFVCCIGRPGAPSGEAPR